MHIKIIWCNNDMHLCSICIACNGYVKITISITSSSSSRIVVVVVY